MISKRSIMVLKPARKPAVLLAIMAVLPALSLWAYEPPISVVVGLLLASVMVATPAIRALWQPRLSLVINGEQLLAHSHSGHLKWRARAPVVRAVVTPWALSLWCPWRPGKTIFRCQLDEHDYRQLAAWLHR